MKITLNTQILIGTVIGVSGGILISISGVDIPFNQGVLYVCGIISSIFVGLLKMILIPLVFTSIVVGIANLRAHAQMQKVWKLSLLYYVVTTMLAVGLGLIVVNVFAPGKGLSVEMFSSSMQPQLEQLSIGGFLENFLSHLFINPIQAMADGQILATIIFAVLLGVALIAAGDKRAKSILNLFNEFFDLVMMIVQWVMKLLPLGILALLVKLVATQNISLFAALGKFIMVVVGALLIHGVVVLPILLKTFGKMSFSKYFVGVRQALITAFCTSSSSATLPITYQCVENNLKVNKDIAGFVLPLGATINMDGTALYEAVAAIFIANIVGIDLNIVQQIVIFLMAILASIGAPGIPSAGLVTMLMVLRSVGLPVEAVAILYPIDRLLDAVRTTVNVEGDTIGSIIVDRYSKD